VCCSFSPVVTAGDAPPSHWPIRPPDHDPLDSVEQPLSLAGLGPPRVVGIIVADVHILGCLDPGAFGREKLETALPSTASGVGAE
jgi:hypothetical protein